LADSIVADIVDVLLKVKRPAAKAAVFALCDAIAPALQATSDLRSVAIGAAIEATCAVLRKKGKAK